ncbi:hypothetical protein, partial [Clostridioides difficile]|uniref:hypothetical protein n=1 Tax=Clostridioides difficile TaxID=1496 RepID=UPI002113D39A
MQIEVVESSSQPNVEGSICSMSMWPTLRDRIRKDQAGDEFVRSMEDKIRDGQVKEFNQGKDGALEYKGRIVVPNVEVLRKEILTEAH